MESRAPVSSVARASPSSWGEVLGVGSRAFRVSSCRLAVERREAIFCGEGGGEDCSWVRVVFSSVVDIVGVAARAGGTVGSCFGWLWPNAEDALERIERSARIAGRKPARSAAERCPIHGIRGRVQGFKTAACYQWGDNLTFLCLVDLVDALPRTDNRWRNRIWESVQYVRKRHGAWRGC